MGTSLIMSVPQIEILTLPPTLAYKHHSVVNWSVFLEYTKGIW